MGRFLERLAACGVHVIYIFTTSHVIRLTVLPLHKHGTVRPLTATTRPVNLLTAESAEIRSTDVFGADMCRSSVQISAGDNS
jgi:hypothetical protein